MLLVSDFIIITLTYFQIYQTVCKYMQICAHMQMYEMCANVPVLPLQSLWCSQAAPSSSSLHSSHLDERVQTLSPSSSCAVHPHLCLYNPNKTIWGIVLAANKHTCIKNMTSDWNVSFMVDLELHWQTRKVNYLYIVFCQLNLIICLIL